MRQSAVTSSILAAVLAFPVLAAAETNEYEVDPVHSGVSFKVRHLVSNTPGTFNEFTGSVRLDPAKPAETLKITSTIQAASIDTRNEKRDGHLRSADFLDVEKHPEIKFESTAAKAAGEKKYEVMGNLTIRGVTKPVTLVAENVATGTNPFTKTPMLGMDLSGKINRKDFGIEWNRQLDEGGFLLGDDVFLEVHIEASVPKQEAGS